MVDKKVELQNDEVQTEENEDYFAICLCLGTAFGIVIKDIAMGISLGLIFAICIGTVVLKDAEVKIFLTASVEARAKRRYLQDKEAGMDVSLEVLKEEIEKRDYQDTHREVSPLKKADDAIVVDSSDLSIDEVVSEILDIINKKVLE